jgi:NADPH:quinone reductase
MTTIPETMRCIEISEPGKPEVLKIGARPVPQPEAGEILVRVESAGVNRPDIFQREGNYPPPPGASDILGLEIAGTVAALGDGVTEWAEGDKVCSLVTGGGYAEFCTAAAAHTLPVPGGLSVEEAGGVPETFFTVWTNVFDRAGLRNGEVFLVHGGSSGIGTTAIQMAKEFGARVFATAGSKEKCEACENLGAERAVNYKDEDFVEVIKGLTDGQGVDVILDMVGGDYVQKNIALLNTEGRLVHIAFLRGPKVEVNLMRTMLKRLSILASTLRPQGNEAKAAIATALRGRVWPAIEAGRIKPVIDSTFPLADAAEAHARMESSGHIGKILLTM